LVDSTDLILLATGVQTVVITLTLLVFIFQFRSQEKALKESSYQNLMGRYNDFILTQATNPTLSKLFTERITRVVPGKQVSEEEASVFAHLLVAYGILEEACILHDKKWIDDETWEQWAAWLRSLAENPQFVLVHKSTLGMFDKGFEAQVSKVVNKE
jgi:hypothetical protein